MYVWEIFVGLLQQRLSLQIFLKRRKSDKISKDTQAIDLHTLKELIKKRDFEDSNRKISPLIKANDAIEIITDGYTINEVVDKIIDLYNDKIPKETEIK